MSIAMTRMGRIQEKSLQAHTAHCHSLFSGFTAFNLPCANGNAAGYVG